jgi:hypothetical protein
MHAHRVFDHRTGDGIRIKLVRLEAIGVVAGAAGLLLLALTHL